MKCPLFTMKSPVISQSQTLLQVECLKQDCAWWNKTSEQCIFPELINLLIAIGNVLGKIESKLPLGRG